MTERQAELLRAIVEDYVKTAEPVGSASLAKTSFRDLSSATLRKEMAVLEDHGLIHQPHTSAGRAPTEAGYRYYIQHFLKPKEPTEQKQQAMARELQTESRDPRELMKRFARALAHETRHTVVFGFGPSDIYFTGISNLFTKPEFTDAATLGATVDHFDDAVTESFNAPDGIEVKVGSECAFGVECGAVLVKCITANGPVLVALVGPMRMPYDRLLGVAHQTKRLLEALDD